LPATAAALNQTSITVGTELGLVIVTSVVAQVAIATFSGSIATEAPSDQAAMMTKFMEVLNAIGTSGFGTLVAGISEEGLTVGGGAYAAGVSASMAIAGAAALIGSVVCWFGIGRRDRLVAVYDLRDERSSAQP
jgi:hypothetical protein